MIPRISKARTFYSLNIGDGSGHLSHLSSVGANHYIFSDNRGEFSHRGGWTTSRRNARTSTSFLGSPTLLGLILLSHHLVLFGFFLGLAFLFLSAFERLNSIIVLGFIRLFFGLVFLGTTSGFLSHLNIFFRVKQDNIYIFHPHLLVFFLLSFFLQFFR